MALMDFLGYVLMIFLFVTYLFILFFILTDLFRDHQLSGWWKAVWIILLIFFPIPFLIALIYLIFRGKGMAQRAAAAQKEMMDAQQAYIQQVAGTSPAEQIATAKSLLDAGTIDQNEFDRLKAQALGS